MKNVFKKVALILSLAMVFTLMCGFRSNAKTLNSGVIDIGTTEAGSTTASTETGTGDTISKPDSSTTEGTSSSTSELEDGIFGSENVDLPDDYKLGDDILPEVDAENFFTRLIHKLFKSVGVVQAIVAIFLILLFVIMTVKIGAIVLSPEKKSIGTYLVALIIIALMLVFDIYAKQIMSMFMDWFVK